MRHGTAWTFSLSFLLLTLMTLFTGCAENPILDPPVKEPLSRIYMDSYDKVWRAIQLSMRRYPVRVNTMESGLLETDYIKDDKLFSDPNSTDSRQAMRYKLTIRAVKGRVENRPSVKVTVIKTTEFQPDFFSGYMPAPSNGLEEDVVLYRIGRFLDIDKLMTKAAAGH